MVKYCVANECPIDEWRVHNAAEKVISRCLKYLREEAKAPWDSRTAAWAALNGHLHILEYLVERKYDQYRRDCVSVCGRERPLRLFEVLARNRQSAVELSRPYETRTRTTTPNVYNTFSTIIVLSHAVGDTRTESYIQIQTDQNQNQNQKQKQKQSNHFYADGCFRKTKRDKNEFLITLNYMVGECHRGKPESATTLDKTDDGNEEHT